MIVRRRLAGTTTVCLLTLCLASTVLASGFGLSDLAGRKTFRSVAESAGTWTVNDTDICCSSWSLPDLGFLEFRGAFEFDGRGSVTGFRLAWGHSNASPFDAAGGDAFEDHRTVPFRQELSGTYSVSPDGIVSMTLEASPPRIFTRDAIYQVGTTTVEATESVTAILSTDGQMDGLFTQRLHHVYPDGLGTEDGTIDAAYSHRFETIGCSGSGGPPSPRAGAALEPRPRSRQSAR